MLNPKEIGRRIKEARLFKGIQSQDALAMALRHAGQSKPLAPSTAKLTRQTVQYWESGKIVPPWDKVELLAEVFGPEYGEKWIMFGDKREDHLAATHPLLTYIDSGEQAVLNEYRKSNEVGKMAILAAAQGISKANPISEADIHLFRRRSDPSRR
jgi:transcriptional regulator with XRE-family HTH domain